MRKTVITAQLSQAFIDKVKKIAEKDKKSFQSTLERLAEKGIEYETFIKGKL